MKRLLKPILMVILFLFLFASCSSFTGQDSELNVEQVKEGTIKITFVDEMGDVKEYIIEKGEDGKSGPGLKEIKEIKDLENACTNLIFLYENEAIDPLTVSIPYPEDGREIGVRVNEETRTIEYQYTGDEEWNELIALSELEGESAYDVYCALVNEGTEPLSKEDWLQSLVGKSAYQSYIDTTGETLSEVEWLQTLVGKSAYEVYCDTIDGTPLSKEEWFETLRGEKGKEISAVVTKNGVAAYNDALIEGFIGTQKDWLSTFVSQDPLNPNLELIDYTVTVYTYNDGSVSDPIFSLRSGGRWYEGNYDPNQRAFGLIGDYYFETIHEEIYTKKANGTWEIVVSLNPTKSTSKVYFHLNDKNGTRAFMPSEGDYNREYFNVIKGTYFRGGEYNNPPIPVPVREGYKFIGWFRMEALPSDFNPYIYIPFNDLTIVATDELHLYAQWEIVE